MKKPFIEDLQSPKADVLHPTSTPFDYAEVEKRLGELPEDDPAVYGSERMAHALRIILSWITRRGMFARRGVKSGGRWARAVGRRTIALAWVVDPSTFEGTPSLSALEAQGEMPSKALSRYAAEATATFGIRNRIQKHGWNRKPRPAESLPGEHRALKKP